MSLFIRKKLGVFALTLIMFIITLDTTITNIALPTITAAFNSTLDISNWISTIYVLVLSALMIPASKIGDQLGRKKVVMLGLFIFGLGSLLCCLSGSIFSLISARGLQGIGGAIATPILLPLCVSLLGRRDANKATGLIGAVAAFSAAIGPLVGGMIIQYWSWKGIFLINIPIVLLTILLIKICFIESYDETISKSIDYIGILLLSGTLFLITFILLKGYDYGWASRRILTMILGTSILLVIFVVTDLHKKEPLIEFKLFKNLTFMSSTAIYFACGFSIVCSSVIFNFFLENVRKYTTLHAGIIIMFSSLMVMFAMPLGNLLGRKLSFRWPLMTGTILMTVGSLLLTQLTYSISTFNMIFSMCVLGFGFGLGSLSLISSIQYIPEEKVGIASGMVNAARQIGTCLGIALLVGLLNNNISNAINTTRTIALHDINTGQLSSKVKAISNKEINRYLTYNGSVKNKRTMDLSQIKTAANDNYNVPRPKSTSDLHELYTKNQQLYNGIKLLPNNFNKIKDGENQISIGIALLAQKHELTYILNHSKTVKNKQLTKAFNNTFLVSTIFLLLFIPIAYLTDKDKIIKSTIKTK